MSPVKDEIMRILDSFPEEMLARVLRLIDQLQRETGAKKPPRPFDGLCGSITKEDAEIMRRAIEEREKVDLNAW